MSRKYQFVLVHPMDPRGDKLGGIETHMRLLVANFPGDFDFVFVGVDEFGDCPVGQVSRITVFGREIDFLPVAAIDNATINAVGKSILSSTSFKFATGLLRYHFALRRVMKGRSASIDLQRFESALPIKLLGRPMTEMIHLDLAKGDKADTLLGRYRFIHVGMEWLAIRLAAHIFTVNSVMLARLRGIYPHMAKKSSELSVPINTQVFQATPFDLSSGKFQITYAGRLDEFKDPPLMFALIAALNERLSDGCVFNYIGSSDPEKFAEFAAIKDITVRHGFQNSSGVRDILQKSHAAIFTSFAEGMPCFMLEALASGRPIGAVRLPQYDPLIQSGVSGEMIARAQDRSETLGTLVDGFVKIWDDLQLGNYEPATMHAIAEPYSIDNQLDKLFDVHRRLQS